MLGRICRQQCRKASQLAELSHQSGLYGISELREPHDWLKLAQKAIKECQDIIYEVKQTPPSPQIIQLLDDISDKVCQVHDSAEFCKHTHSDVQWQQAALQTTVHLGGFVGELNANKDLYDKLCGSLDSYDQISSQASTSQASASQDGLVGGYTREAVHVGRLLKRDFDKGGVSLGEEERQRIMALQSSIYYTGSHISQNLAEDAHHRDRQISRSLLHSRKESERRKGWMQWMSTPKENLKLMDSLADSRFQLAACLGAESYADYALDSATLAGHPAAVTAFLNQLHQTLQHQMEEEITKLQETKRAITNDSSPVRVWDRDLCIRSYKAAAVGRAGPSACFAIPQLLRGFQEIVRKVFGISASLEPMQPGEGWAEGIIKLEFSSPEEGPLGHVYIDSLARPGKFSGCAHFTLRCRRQLPNGGTQLPMVALVFNFLSRVLTPAEARTVFHELGHAMHSILSKTQFQHLAGTRGPLDMIEIPSHFFEHFLTSPEGLRICLKHGEPIPSTLQQAIQQQWSILPALEMNDSIVHSMMDQVFHGRQMQGNLSAGMSAAVRELSPFLEPEDPNICHHLRFGHLVGYPASYYSYVYAQFIADALWRKWFADDPLSRQAGDHVKSKLLALGGSKEPRALLADLLGPDSLQNISGGWAPVVGKL